MTTAFSNGPGFYAAFSRPHNPRIPAGKLRIYMVRLEAHDIDATSEDDAGLDVNFQVLFAQAEGNPEIAHALIELGRSIEQNRKMLEAELNR